MRAVLGDFAARSSFEGVGMPDPRSGYRIGQQVGKACLSPSQ